MSKVTTKIPDGKGGWIEVEGDALEGKKADLEKQQRALEEQFYKDASAMTEYFWKIGRLYQTENGLDPAHVAFAVSLLCINVRETYPKGKEEFDRISGTAADYFDDARAHG